jgi:hypothetical protein
MIGRKTLGEIREELRRAFAADGGDPIQRLNELMKRPTQDSEVLESLKRLLESPKRKKPKRRPATKR